MKSKDNMPSFEERLAELESLSQGLRSGKLPLNEAIDAFERGIKLANSLEKELKQMQLKVEKLLSVPSDPDTPAEKELFDEE